jgi:hypothetical protein
MQPQLGRIFCAIWGLSEICIRCAGAKYAVIRNFFVEVLPWSIERVLRFAVSCVSGTRSSSDTAIMRGRGAAFGPDTLKAIGEAFDAAWSEIACRFSSDPVVIEAARSKLADALLSIAATEDSRDVDVLKRAALQLMALDRRCPSS